MSRSLHEAKARFSELVQKAIDDGPQTVTRRGKPSVVVLSTEQYELMKKRQIDFKEFLAAVPLDGLEIAATPRAASQDD